jgi:predicted acylesterase/phospholipase RssA
VSAAVGDEEQPEKEPDPYLAASLECDVVMKGGITSGVVYPRAITTLAKRYCFRSIGGTSAGAIAAAVTAAAEYRRLKGDGGCGFREVDKLPKTLSDSTDGVPFTLQLFTPDEETRPFFQALVDFKLHGIGGGLIRLFKWFWQALVPPVVLLAAAILVCALTDAPAVYAVLAGFAAILFVIVGLVTEVLLAVRTIGDNDFGIGHLNGEQALTPWLHAEIQKTAGLDADGPPLTFAQLWGVDDMPDDDKDKDKPREERIEILSREPRRRRIDLQMMTTSLTHGRPMRLPAPMRRDRGKSKPEDGGELLFKPSEMARFFPPAVVQHLREHGKLPEGKIADLLDQDPDDDGAMRHFPIGPDLPVIVATRMSLSFPILIAALSLHEYDFVADPDDPPLKPVVFSDGGITSNFPIHFFDSPVPTRPTFGLQLTGFERGKGPDEDHPEQSVEDPPLTGSQTRRLRADMHDLPGFLAAIKDAMQNWRDNTQSELPGFRERIERIKLARDQGGLNLTMTKDQIDALTEYGEIAGERLVRMFTGSIECDPEETKRLKIHRFARYRVTLSVLERFLGDFAYGYRHGPELGTPYPELVDEGSADGSYRFGSEARKLSAAVRSEIYAELGEGVTPATSLDDSGVPRPSATLRTVPPT